MIPAFNAGRSRETYPSYPISIDEAFRPAVFITIQRRRRPTVRAHKERWMRPETKDHKGPKFEIENAAGPHMEPADSMRSTK